jgi:hypothetical protein
LRDLPGTESPAGSIRSVRQARATSALTLLDVALIAYLALPLLIFCAWFKLPFAIGLALLLSYASWKTLADVRWREFDVRAGTVAAIVAVSLAWTALAGVGHFFYANTDWIVRDAVLHDLAATAWPPQYPTDGDFALILRAPIAYYLPAAVVGWLGGAAAGDFALYLWTVLGFALFLCAVTTLFSTPRQRWMAVLLMIGFGGMDLVAWSLAKQHFPTASQHLEAWSYLAQYSSNSTLLFWVPNHALPAWLGTALILRLWRQPSLARIAPLMAAAIPLWSPLAAIGLAPFYVASLDWRRDFRGLFAIGTGLPFLAMALLVARYVTLDAVSIPGGWAFHGQTLGEYLPRYVSFCLIEFVVVAWALHRLAAYDLVLTIAVVVLSLLPLYRFGAANDLAMRSSIPALTVLALAAVRPVVEPRGSAWRYLLILVLLIGAAGAAHEPIRAFQRPRWEMTGRTLPQAMEPNGLESAAPLPTNYVANLSQPGMAAMLREPTMVKKDAAAPASKGTP